ncbi:MAG: helix-turn-helix transcriptional regulator [Patescibacteria group bacterium]
MPSQAIATMPPIFPGAANDERYYLKGRPANKMLSARETQILDLLCEGQTSKGIARVLGISMFTAKNHVQRIIRKMEVSNRAHAVSEYRLSQAA